MRAKGGTKGERRQEYDDELRTCELLHGKAGEKVDGEMKEEVFGAGIKAQGRQGKKML